MATIIINNNQVQVKKHSAKKKRKPKLKLSSFEGLRPRPKPCDIDYEIISQLRNIEDIEEQMDELVQILELTQEDFDERAKIAQHIQNAVSDLYPNCVVYLFGSTVNGLGFKGCDIDAFVDLGLTEEKWTTGSRVSSLDRDDQTRACGRITNLLKKEQNQKYIGNVSGIPKARVPIVKFVHIKTGISCDLSFRNPMAVLNTDYIRLCVEADSRVRIVMVPIRYWAARGGLSGGGKGNRNWRFTNYALSMLVIFYLQTEGVLPTAQFLIDNINPKESAIVDGWQCGFSHDLTTWNNLAPNTKSPLELLQGFFNFYANFDYENAVICPNQGIPLNKDMLKRNLADEQNWKTCSVICVQDPFELDHCIVKGYCASALEGWKKRCKETYEVLTNGSAASLLKIFELEPLIHEPSNKQVKKFREKIEKVPKPWDKEPSSGPHFRFALEVLGDKLELNKIIMQILKEIMEQVFKMKIEEKDLPERALEDCGSFVKRDENIGKSLACAALVALWDHRKVAKTDLGMTALTPPSIENEKKISDLVFNKFGFNNIDYTKLNPEVIFDLSFHWIEDNTLCVHLKCIAMRKKMGGKILGFLHDYLPEVLEYELKSRTATSDFVGNVIDQTSVKTEIEEVENKEN